MILIFKKQGRLNSLSWFCMIMKGLVQNSKEPHCGSLFLTGGCIMKDDKKEDSKREEEKHRDERIEQTGQDRKSVV